MADNTTLNTGSGGDTYRSLEDGSSIKHPVGIVGYATTLGTPNVISIPTAAALADDMANPTTLLSGACMMFYDGATWDRWTGTLSANSGVDIGDVDILSVIPGTGASNLGKAEDAAHSSGDVGVMALGVQQASPLAGKFSGTDGDYEPLHIVNQRLMVAPNIVQVVDNFSDHTSWTAFNDDCTSIADETTNYLAGGSAVSFAKANGTANTTYALIQKTITAVNFLNGITGAAYLQLVIYIPDTTNVTNAVLRLGTDSTNYGEWDLGTATAANGWNNFRVPLTSMSSATGTGWNGSAVTYVAVGLQFAAETDTLAGIIADALIFNAGNVVEADITSTANVDSANVNVQKIGNIVVARGSGNVSTGTQRVTVATDDVNLAAQTTALQIIDDWDESDRAKVNVIAGQAGIAAGAGAVGATVPRVTLASDDPAVALLGTIDADTSALTTGSTPGKLISAASTNATSIKASAGTLHSLSVTTTDATPVYVKFYNKASAPTVGTDIPVQVWMAPGSATGGGIVAQIPICGIAFSTGIAFAITTGAADSDTGAVAANEVVVSYSYK